MAVVFISPKKKQKAFLVAISTGGLLLLGIIFLWSFLAPPSRDELKVSFNKPKVVVNLKILDSDQFKKLEYFETIPRQFSYAAENKAKKTVTGVISADSEAHARNLLEDAGLKVGQIKEVEGGRDNPFIPYATPSSALPKTATTKK